MFTTTRRSLAPTLLLISLLLPTTTSAQPNCPAPPNALDTISIDTPIGDLWSTTDTSEVEYETMVGNIGLDTLLTIIPDSIRFRGPCVGLDTLTLSRLFDRLVRDAVENAIDIGIISTGSGPSQSTMTDVRVPVCVTRTGSGSGTRLSSVDPCNYATWRIEYYEQSGTVTTAIDRITGCDDCSVGEKTCPDDDEPGIE